MTKRASRPLEAAYAAVRELIRVHQTPLRSRARELLRHDTLEGKHLEKVLDSVCGWVMHEHGREEHIGNPGQMDRCAATTPKRAPGQAMPPIRASSGGWDDVGEHVGLLLEHA